MFEYVSGCGPGSKEFANMEKMWNEGKYYAPLQHGEIAMAPDDVVAKSMGLDADTPVDTYFRLAREMCLRMQHNESLGLGPKCWRHWFVDGYLGGGGDPYYSKTSTSSAPSDKSAPRKKCLGWRRGKGLKKAKCTSESKSKGGTVGEFDFPDEPFNEEE